MIVVLELFDNDEIILLNALRNHINLENIKQIYIVYKYNMKNNIIKLNVIFC